MYLIYRWILAIVFIIWLGLNGGDGPKFFIFLTNWSYLLWNAYLLVSAISCTATYVLYHFCCREKFKKREKEDGNHCQRELVLEDKPVGCCGAQSDKSCWYHKVHWLLFTLGTETAIAVTILYWALLYRPGMDSAFEGGSLMTHLINGIMAVADILLTGIPVHLLHVVYILCFSSTYASFAGIYFAANGTNVHGEPFIYDVIDYGNEPETAAAYTIVVGVIFYPLMHLILYCLYLAREGLLYHVWRFCCHRNHTHLTSYEMT